MSSRRQAISAMGTLAVVGATDGPVAVAVEYSPDVTAQALSKFKDPLGLFEISLPKGWYKVRPTAAGDLPNSDGKGRRGARIFSAGEVSNPYAPFVLSVERFPARSILEYAGVLGDPGSLDTWSRLGKAQAVAELLVNRRDAETVPASQAFG